MNRQSGDITTLGRGGSDTTAVALTAALNADVCEDLLGRGRRVHPSTRASCRPRTSWTTITSEEMLEMAANGAKILHLRSVECVRRFNLKLHVFFAL